jgi:hypothetical protein
MGNADLIGDPACIVNVLPGTACPLLFEGGAMVIKLQSDANGFIARGLHQCGNNGGIHAAGHGNNYTGFGAGLIKAQINIWNG